MRILVFDNYDSFTYNLVHLVEKLTDAPVDVLRNDETTLAEIAKYDKIILSPGPGLPKDAGLMPVLIKNFASQKSILGVCLGHQAIGEAFGGQLINLEQVYHGVSTSVEIGNRYHPSRIFHGLPPHFEAGLYHSWVVSAENFPESLEITAVDKHGYVMGLQHKTFDLQGVQFHPESIMTPLGETMIRNWLNS
jgi:anthranilate synthase component II